MATTLNNSDSSTNLDWEAYENNTKDRKYDEPLIYKQGIAIVKRNGKFGAVMVGGKEIVPPIYDDLSEFKDGYAVAKWNGEERVVNLSGQVRVLKGDKEIFLPEEYDWGLDFIEDICIVVKNDKYGIIDHNFNVRLECEYDSFSNYHNGYAVFSKDRWSECPTNVYNGYDVWSDDFLIDNKGKVSYKIKESFTDGHKIVCSVGDQQKLYGVMGSNMDIIILTAYTYITRLRNGYYVANSDGNLKLFFHPSNGNIVCEKIIDRVYDYLDDLNENFFVIYQKDNIQKEYKTSIFTSPDSLQFCFPSQVHVESDGKGGIFFNYNRHKYKYDVDGNLYIVATNYSSSRSRLETIVIRKVNKNHLNFIHTPFPITSRIKNYEIIENADNLKGISDLYGNTLIVPQYRDIISITEDLFIVSIPSKDNNAFKCGVVDISNYVKIPFEFNGLIPINDIFLAYTDTCHISDLPSYKSNSYHLNVKFGIIDINGNKITEPKYSSITIEKSSSTFIVGVGGKYGIINTKGECILDNKYNTIEFNEQTNSFIVNIIHYPYETKSNIVSLDGFYIVKNSKEDYIKVPTQIVEWCGDFSEDGIASVIKNGYSGHINELNQFVSFMDEKKIIMPSRFDFIRDFTNGYAPVLLGGKYGIVNDKFELIIPCEYEYIEALSDVLFKFREGGKWGVVDNSNKLIASAEYNNITYETESLLMVETRVQNGSSTEPRYGLLDWQGCVVISAVCKTITKIEHENNIFFIAEKNFMKGVLDKKGNIIVPFIYNYISDGGSPFYCVYHKNYDSKDNKFHSFYKSNGERFICIDIGKDCCQTVTVPADYEYAAYVDYGIIKVSKSEKWGLIDILGNIISEPQYSSINIFEGSFAKVSKYFDDNETLYGLIDTRGEVVLPIEYEEIKKWDNDYYVVRKNGLYGLLSPTLLVVIEPSKNYLKKLDEKYILVKCPGYYSNYGLIDYYGNEIIPADGGHYSFSEIEVLENGFLKVIYHRAEYKVRNQSRIGILDSKGKELYNNDECEDITYFGDGLLLVNQFLYTTYGGAGHNTFNLVNLQGKKLFHTYYDSIDTLKNGNFLISKNNCYGIAKNTGEILVQPKYKSKINFENGFSEIKIKDGDLTHKINEDGQVIVSDENKNEVIIPKDYYWGTDFINGISIVRSIKNDKLGVINKEGDVLITPEYDAINLLSDNTLQVGKYDYCREYYYYGLYDISGKCIFPAIFKVFEHLNKNRIRVVWNINNAQNWSPGEYISDPNKCLGEGGGYVANNRSALCDSKGNLISNKDLVCVGEFKNGYARSSLTLYIKDNQVYLKQVGIININGETIVPPEYDRITLYDHSFALLKKDGRCGLADLKNRKTILFNDINIKRPEFVDSFGRFIYTDGDCSNQTNNKGVIGPKGIILPSGKYSHIELLKNGLIKVSNEENTLHGLLDLKGKELLKMGYSYISAFQYGYASVCIGGHYEKDDISRKLVKGKWGIIDRTGKFIVKCIYNEKQELSAEDIIKYNLIDDSEFDSYGRLLFIGTNKREPKREETTYNADDINMNGIIAPTQGDYHHERVVGVVGLNSIIVPPGKYPNIRLLENGLIEVLNQEDTFDSIEENTLYGLLDLNGKELLEMKYSYISEFKNGYAYICIGGHFEKSFLNKQHVGGKWGVVYKTGKVVIECVNDKEHIEKFYETLVLDSSETLECDCPKVICSDSIPVTVYDEVYNDYSDDYYSGGYDDEPSINDNPYYNDNIDMDQQSIEFWNNL